MLFFFFQAEDGIRDDLVTGVQTCALPISDLDLPVATSVTRNVQLRIGETSVTVEITADAVILDTATRSEERRVGKECRSRWATCTEQTTNSRQRRPDVARNSLDR